MVSILLGRFEGHLAAQKLLARGRPAAILAVLIAVGCAAIAASAAFASQLQIQMSATGSAISQGCPGGAPCTERVTYDGQTSDTPSPFTAFPYFRQPVRLTGYLDFPISSTGDCLPGVSGVFQVLAARGGGSKERVAFEIVVNNATATCDSGHHSLSAAFAVDSTNTEDPAFRDAVGSGVMSLQDGPPGVFSADVAGTIDVRH